MAVLGLDNSRMKDFYDLSMIAARFEIEPALLARAIKATFERRNTAIPDAEPIALSRGFARDEKKKAQWAAFLRRNDPRDVGRSLIATQRAVAKLVLPALDLVRNRRG